MAKKVTNYYCKDCSLNNNGWCPKLKRNGLKDITEEQCGGNKIPDFMNIIVPTPIDEDDILAKASLNMPEEMPGIIPPSTSSINRAELLAILKDALSIEATSKPGMIPGSKIVEIAIKLDDETISDTDFLVK